MTTQRLPERSWVFIILLYLCIIYLPLIISRSDTPESFLQGDSFYYRAVIESMLKDGDLLLANNVPTDPLSGDLAIGMNGFVPKHPILMPLVSLPFYALFGTPGLLLFNLLDCMILFILIYKLNCIFFDRAIAFITTILYATGTLFFDYAFNYSPDIFSTVLLLGGLYFVLQERFYIGVFLLGLSIFAKLPNVPLTGVILLYAGFVIWKRGGQTHSNMAFGQRRLIVILLTAILFFVALIPFVYTNTILFGSPLVTGYQRMALADANGQMLSVDHEDLFQQPLFKGIYQSLLDPRHGVLLTNPVLFLAFLGVVRLRRVYPQDKAYLLLLLCLIQFLLFAKYDLWYTSHFSNRFLMTFIALSSVFTANFLSHVGFRLFAETPTSPSP